MPPLPLERGLQPVPLFSVLARHEVAFVLFGTLGAIARGARLTTGDADICPALNGENLGRLARALDELQARRRHIEGFPHLDVDSWQNVPRVAESFDSVLETPYGELDVVPYPYGPRGKEERVDHARLAAAATTLDAFGQLLHVASLGDLVASKLSAQRPKDEAVRAELERLIRVRTG